ncbi:FAD-binding protein [Streptomyces sp. WMMB 322]|uniref:FAD-binding protein n=1 Tax=Streptomyces sp. WMMB 322 TaxID=1286821 RepID=UPI0006E46644|nr:FAD-binding protein [Streptomyces sp. WMMB 322]SCK51677.1 FAD/FMN-containing dehydrogenase [Streptomyces sp. WMMB 322]
MRRERSEPSRRTAALYGLTTAAVAVVGFDPSSRAWATERTRPARSADGGGFDDVPPLDGQLLTDDASRDAAADDFGHIVHRRPAAVLRPGSVDDVVVMVRFCRKHGIPVAPRGQGHATNGQAQTEGGLVIETAPLKDIGPVQGVGKDRTVTVGAGALWSAVAKSTLRDGLTPPVFTDYLELSVGGTLSVGGLGGQTHRHGSQTDTVTELQVVTGAGELVRCSATRHADLFDAVRAGLGQCAIVVAATLRLVRAPETVRHFQLPYTDLAVFLEDQRRLTQERRFDYVEGLVFPDETGAFRVHVLEAVAYGPPAGPEPDDEALLEGLRFESAGMTADTLDYYTFLDRLAPGVAEQKEQGLWDDPHPWLNLLLPSASVEPLASGILDNLKPEDVGTSGVVLLYPLHGDVLHTPMLRMPHDPAPYLLAVLRTSPPDEPATVDRLLAANRAAYEKVRDAGGKQYPVGSIPFQRADWRDHFGGAWPALEAARRRYDPDGILVPGQGIF